jgi:hypothetical protein
MEMILTLLAITDRMTDERPSMTMTITGVAARPGEAGVKLELEINHIL